MSLESLPNEILLEILKQLPTIDQKAARLTCRVLALNTNDVLFRMIYFEIEKASLIRLCNLATSSHLRTMVRTLIFRKTQNTLFFSTFEDFAACIESAQALKSNETWSMMNQSQRRQIYKEYRREPMRKEGHCHQLYNRMVKQDDSRKADYSPDEEMESILTAFEQGLRGFSSLRSIKHIATYRDIASFSQWRSFQLDTQKIDYFTTGELEQDMGAMHLCYISWCFAAGSFPKNQLTSLDIDVQGPAFWTPWRLYHLMKTDGSMWDLRMDYHEDAEYEAMRCYRSCPTVHVPIDKVLLNMKSSFMGLTQLNCAIDECGGQEQKSMIEHLCSFLGKCLRLRSLELSFGNLYFGGMYCTPSDEELEATRLLFEGLCRTNLPKTVEYLGLKLKTTVSDLLTFLCCCNGSLKTLQLTKIAFPRAEGDWQTLLESLQLSVPSLEHVKLVEVKDYALAAQLICSTKDGHCEGKEDCHRPYIGRFIQREFDASIFMPTLDSRLSSISFSIVTEID